MSGQDERQAQHLASELALSPHVRLVDGRDEQNPAGLAVVSGSMRARESAPTASLSDGGQGWPKASVAAGTRDWRSDLGVKNAWHTMA